MTDGSPPDSGAADDLDEVLESVHEHLVATGALPVERTAARWIGEAEAIAGDVATADLESAVLASRLGHVRSLLAEVESTGDDQADEHLERARALTNRALERLDADPASS